MLYIILSRFSSYITYLGLIDCNAYIFAIYLSSNFKKNLETIFF